MAVVGEEEAELLAEFERGLDPQQPEGSRIPARVLGYGEISTVFEIAAAGLEGLAVKRLPLFESQGEVDAYLAAFEEYLCLLTAEVGLGVPAHEHAVVAGRSGRPVVYLLQPKMPAVAFGHRALHRLPEDGVREMVRRVLVELHKVWAFNQRNERQQIGIDGQLSNWAFRDLEQSGPRTGAAPSYLDTSTPFVRIDGVEQLNAELFLRSAPSFLVWILRLLFLKEVVGRYYDFHLVAVDLAANFYKEQRPELIPMVVETINEFFAGEAGDLKVGPVSEKEVQAYYREDALIWRLYLGMRKVDRFLRRKVLRGDYPYILPGRIKR